MHIRGSMSKDLSTLGITMKGIRSKICKDIKMRNAEQIMELLVGKKIIDLKHSIKLAYVKCGGHIFSDRGILILKKFIP